MSTEADFSTESVSEAGSGTESSVAPGEILKRAREARGETLSNVAQILKLSPQQLEALENGRFDILPGPTFVRGFLRNYARYLGISPDPLLAVINGRVPASANLVLPVFRTGQYEQFEKAPRRRSPLLVLLILLVLAGLGVVGLGFYKGWFEFKFKLPAVVATWGHVEQPASQTVPDTPVQQVEPEAPAAPVAPTRAAPPSRGQSAPQPPATQPPATQPPATATPPATAAQPPATQPPATQPPATAAQPPALPPGVSVLHMSFRHKTLVKVRESTGKLIFTQLVQGGGSHGVKGKPPFTISITQPKNVSLENNIKLEFDGQPVEWRGRVNGDGSARLILK